MSDIGKLTITIKEHLRRHPLDGPDLLQAVAEGLALYREAVDSERKWQARSAIANLLSLVKTKKKGMLPLLIDAAFYHFPKGVTSHSPSEVAFWHLFINAAQEAPVNRVWLENLKGPEYVEWWDQFVAPCLQRA